jgi:hypothetical protein
MSQLAEAIVDAILANLKDRQGIGNELEAIDETIYAEMRVSLVESTDMVLDEHGIAF